MTDHPIDEPTVFIVDDEPCVCDAIKFTVESAGLTAHAYHSAAQFLCAVTPDMRGCLVLDLQMPELDGRALQKELNKRGLHIPIIIVTAHASVSNCLQTLKGGAVDFIEKPLDKTNLLNSVRSAIELDATRHRERAMRDAFAGRFAALSAREKEVFALLVAGKTTKQIAFQLGISIKTVDNHRNQVLRKMDVDSIVELVHLAISVGGPAHVLPAPQATDHSQLQT